VELGRGFVVARVGQSRSGFVDNELIDLQNQDPHIYRHQLSGLGPHIHAGNHTGNQDQLTGIHKVNTSKHILITGHYKVMTGIQNSTAGKHFLLTKVQVVSTFCLPVITS